MSSTQNKIALASRIMFPGMPAGERYEVFEINMWTLYCVKICQTLKFNLRLMLVSL